MHFHDKHFSEFYPPSPASAALTTATLTDTVAANVWSLRFSASGASSAGAIGFFLPLPFSDQSLLPQQGCYVKTCDFWYRVDAGVASGTVAAALYYLTLTAHGTKPSAAQLAAASPGDTSGYYKATLTLSPYLWVQQWKALYLSFALTGSTGYNVYFYGARLNYEFRR